MTSTPIWRPISEHPQPPDQPRTAMIRHTDHDDDTAASLLLPGPVMWDTTHRRWVRESGEAIHYRAGAVYHWRDEEDILKG